MFKNREVAAERLAEKLGEDVEEDIDVVSAATFSSVRTAELVAEELGLPVNHVISTKLFVPGRQELVFGAVSYDGTIWLNDHMIEEFKVDRDFITDCAERRRNSILDRMSQKGIETRDDLNSENILIVADGISSGMRVAASLGSCTKKNTGKKYVAAPFVSKHGEENIRDLTDDVFCLKTPRFVASVKDGYIVPQKKNILKS